MQLTSLPKTRMLFKMKLVYNSDGDQGRAQAYTSVELSPSQGECGL